jgi:hypothetical protein
MQFIERLSGMSLDNGSGGLELLLILAPIVAIAALYRLRVKERATRSRRHER